MPAALWTLSHGRGLSQLVALATTTIHAAAKAPFVFAVRWSGPSRARHGCQSWAAGRTRRGTRKSCNRPGAPSACWHLTIMLDEPPQMYEVAVPGNCYPGQAFQASVGGQLMVRPCPSSVVFPAASPPPPQPCQNVLAWRAFQPFPVSFFSCS